MVATEAEALLAEQNFIKQYRPRFNIRLRDDKSYPYIAISLDEDFPRVYFTRERHRRDRAYFGPYSNAKRVRVDARGARQGVPVPLLHGARAGRRRRRSLPRLLHQALRGAVRRVRRREDYREGIDGVIAFLSGRYKEIERELEGEMRLAAAEQRYEEAARERNRLRAVRSLLERQRVADEPTETLDAIAVAVGGREANAQVFQVRDGSSPTARASISRTRPSASWPRWGRSSCSSTTAAGPRSRRCSWSNRISPAVRRCARRSPAVAGAAARCG